MKKKKLKKRLRDLKVRYLRTQAALQCAAEIIEATYDHDDDGVRTDDDGPHSGSDIVEMLMNAQGTVLDALEERRWPIGARLETETDE